MSGDIVVKHDQGGKRLEVRCIHENGLIYVIPSEANWVCSEDSIHTHSIAGFFRELVGLKNLQVAELMQRWGLYFRQRSLEDNE